MKLSENHLNGLKLYCVKRVRTLYFRGLIYDWMEHYRVAVGISPSIRITPRSKRRAMSHSARSVPGYLPSGLHSGRVSLRRSPSAPPRPHPKGKPWDRPGSQSVTRPQSSVDKRKLGVRIEDGPVVSIEVPVNELRSRIASKVASPLSG